MSNFKPIKQVKASDEVFNQLKSAIFDGQYCAGDKLPSERELIETFSVSRTVIRESFKALEANGLIEIKQGATGGAFVKQMTFERLTSATKDLFFLNQMSFREICEARLEIEPMVARLAAEHCTEEHKALLLDACAHESDSLQYPETVLLRSQVHYILADMCGNRFLTAIDKSLIQLVGRIAHKFQPDTDKIHPAGMHDDLVQAVINKDGDTAEKLMHFHLKDFLDILQKIESDFRESHS
ncbi:FadR/GntR family transcriptional regulator [Shewanella sp. KT0246]|uniref:FadR/GntR family transcriptional regulator n=1 Tax=Shewanella sp. KT0246 TaxID=2815912 RepID=UPI001BC115BC|nr:FadR/GntR family transcriptional regulator [Shewanella sp. KT0246]GIU49207.1 GntR family transcriptional regulator [Shewanella sp. KT0246]